MVNDIVWTELAESDLNNIAIYLLGEWSERTLNTFYLKLELALSRIQGNPKQFPFLNKSKRYRRCVVSKQNTIYYKEFDKHIVILRIFDNRSNPKKRRIKL